ncbi:MAG: hypothetical protein AB7O59_13060 [Pirellulales bacterium]
MKCKACWAERAEVCRNVRWKTWLAACVFCAPVRCRHCYYEYFVPLWMAGAHAHRNQAAAASAAGEHALRRAA